MDSKPKISLSIPRIIAILRHFGGGVISPDVMWKIILSVLFLGMIAVTLFAYLTFSWAIKIEAPTPASSGGRDTFSVSELHAVIELYEKKEERYKELLTTPPLAPSYTKGKGLAASSTVADLELLESDTPVENAPEID